MQSFVSLWSTLFSEVSSFLMNEPMIYFVGMMILCLLIGAFRKLISW